MSGYGLTEAPILTMAAVDDTDEVLAKTEGQADAGRRACAGEARRRGRRPGEEGEIRAKAPQLMQGYLD